MARIRSVHPGLASDESYMSMSMAAKAAWPLLWMECDDKGVFEWKPIVLKARIFPADNVNFADILSEWEGLNCVRQFTVDGKTYGAVRNFRKFQRPKTPNDVHPITAEIRNYVGLGEVISEIEDDKQTQFPPNGEKSPQMEDGGGRMKGEGGKMEEVSPPLPPIPDDCEEAFSSWNSLASEINLPRAQRLTDPRRKALRQRLADCGGLGGWEFALGKIRGSPFLRGENKDGWRADFDFVLQAKSFTKLMEGSYDAKPTRTGSISESLAAADAVIDEFERRQQAGGEGHHH